MLKTRFGQGNLAWSTELFKLGTGPIHLKLIREEARRVKNATAEGGSILITYGLRREFILNN